MVDLLGVVGKDDRGTGTSDGEKGLPRMASRQGGLAQRQSPPERPPSHPASLGPSMQT